MMLVTKNLLALGMHRPLDRVAELRIKAGASKRSENAFFEHIRTTTAYIVFPDWEALMITLIASKQGLKAKGESGPKIS